MLASAVDASSMATPTNRTRSAPPPTVCDQASDVRPVDVVAARLAASKPMAACAEGDAASPTPNTRASDRAPLDRRDRSMVNLLTLKEATAALPDRATSTPGIPVMVGPN